jgi:hypothetical protein
MPDEVKLLPCPWCGDTTFLAIHGSPSTYVMCTGCGGEGPWNDDGNDEQAIAAWNTRPTIVTDEVVEMVEWEISAWAFAHNIDGAARNDLMARIRAAMPAIDQDGGE